MPITPSPVKLVADRQSTLGAARRAEPRSLSERTSGLTLLLAGVDVVAAVLACAVLAHLPLWWALGLSALTIACRTNVRLYRRRLRLSYFDDLPRALAATCTAFGGTIAAIMLLGSNAITSVGLLRAALAFLLISESLRIMVFQVARTARRRLRRGDRTLVVGTDEVSIELMRNMLEHPEFGLRPVGFVDRQVIPHQAPRLPAPLLPGDLAEAIVRERIGTVVLARPSGSDSVDESITALRMGCVALVLPRMHELYHDDVNVERLRSYPLVRLNPDPTRRPAWLVKRLLDASLALVASVLLLPVMAAAALAVLVESGRPIFFAQVRVGMNGRHFKIYKFRSMKATAVESATTWNIAGDPRIGPVGRFIRATSLDELPQLWNILRGDMSLVGPRPERPGFVDKFSADHERYWARHRVPPGLTGLAQINGLRGDTSIADRVRYDNYYIANWSLWLDAKIVPMTVREVLRRQAR